MLDRLKFTHFLFILFLGFVCTIIACGGGGSNSSELSSENNSSIEQSQTSGQLAWPVACTISDTCSSVIGFPDIDGDWVAFNCLDPGYLGHVGTDISTADGLAGADILAAADGEVLWVLDGRYDECEWTISEHPDCIEPTSAAGPNVRSGYMTCTSSKPQYCEGSGYSGSCYWCTYGGNQIVIRHYGIEGVFATTYDHLKKNSATVRAGDLVKKGQKIAEMGSAGMSSAPHLHFGVWGSGFGKIVDPWAGSCGPNTTQSLWENEIQDAAISSMSSTENEDEWNCDETNCVLEGYEDYVD